MIEAHDIVASKQYDSSPESSPIISASPIHTFNGVNSEAIRMVGIRKTDEEPLVSLI